jgi:beta-lactamase regulating signal transducer with metallopeptidase domain
MSPEVCLHFAATCLNYLLRIAAGYFACWMLNRLLRKPQQRFVVWTGFLLVSAVYWVGLVWRELRALGAAKLEIGNAPSPTPLGTAHSFLVPLGWSHTIVVVIQALGLAYIAALVLLIGVMVIRHLRLRLLLQRTIAPSEPLAALFGEICRDLEKTQPGISRAQLLILPGLKSPATAGWWNPRILLPEICEELGPTQPVADVLCHELIHVARRDYFWAGLDDLICCLLFFHPAVWKARREMALQAELACDLAVLEARPGNRADYAGSLTYFVRLRMLQEGFSLGVDFAASASLNLRIRTILAAPTSAPWWKRCSRMTAGAALLGALGIVAPALEVPLGFAQPIAMQTLFPPPAQNAVQPARKSHHASHRAAGAATPDTLTTLRAKSYVPETPAYTMSSGSSLRPGSERAEPDSPAWRESQPVVQRPSVSSVVRATLGEIVSRGIHVGRDKDKDDH